MEGDSSDEVRLFPARAALNIVVWSQNREREVTGIRRAKPAPPMRSLAMLSAVVMLAAGCRGTPARTAPAPARQVRIFLLVGQSNMAGRGTVEAEDRVGDQHVLMLDRNGQWVPAVEPMHFDKATAGVGPGRAFGIALARHDTTRLIGLVPAAVGGTSIVWWEPGAEDPATKTHPYDDAIRRARIAMQEGELAGIIWHQGRERRKCAGRAALRRSSPGSDRPLSR